MSTYKEWVHWLENRSIMPLVKPGLENTLSALKEAQLLDRIDPAKVIHIAGTNGKGTTAKTLEQLLLAQGKNVGLFTSPHLEDTCERIRKNNKNISAEDFSGLCEKYKPLIEKWNLSHFETLTLFAMDYFFNKDSGTVDHAIFEIGLGGTWDSTNAIPHSTSVITTIGFDHMHILGNSIEEIAENKFGIIQQKNKVLHYPYPDNIKKILAEKVKTRAATSQEVAMKKYSIDTSGALPVYILQTDEGSAPLSLKGKRAVENMGMALEVYKSLGFSVTPQALSVLSEISWPARMTPLKTALPAPVYLSGDHNVQGLESLMEILKESRYKNLYLILGLSKNRRHEDFIEKIKTLSRCELLLTKPEFHGVLPDNKEYPFFAQPQQALESLQNKTQAEDLVVVTGSLYLCGDLMRAASLQR